MLWRSFAAQSPGGALNLLVPVLVMAAGQLAGGLAWLTISGEDAPDLVATAPIPPHFVLRAQTEAGVLAVDDCEIAASQFLEACKATLVLPVLFNFRAAPPPERIRYVVGIAVKTFLAAYRAK